MRGLGQVVHILMLPFCMMPYISTVFVAQSGATFDEAFGMVHMHVDDEDAGSQCLIMTHKELSKDALPLGTRLWSRQWVHLDCTSREHMSVCFGKGQVSWSYDFPPLLHLPIGEPPLSPIYVPLRLQRSDGTFLKYSEQPNKNLCTGSKGPSTAFLFEATKGPSTALAKFAFLFEATKGTELGGLLQKQTNPYLCFCSTSRCKAGSTPKKRRCKPKKRRFFHKK